MRITAQNPTPATPQVDDVVSQLETALVQTVERLLVDAFQQLAPQANATPEIAAGPSPSQGSLQVNGNEVVTPGGFRVIAHGSSSWEIEDPYGHCTDVSGDPHVSVDEKHVFDFKRETSFLLPDGTRIACQTAPAGNGMTLSSGLTIMNGAQQVKIGNLQGAPQMGAVTALEGNIDSYAADEDVLRYGLSNHHAGWNLVRDESGHAGRGEVTGDAAGGDALTANGAEIGYQPLPGETGPCAGEHGGPTPENPGPPPTKPKGPTNENPGPPPTKPGAPKPGAPQPRMTLLTNPLQQDLDLVEKQLEDLLTMQLRRVIVG